MRFEDLEVWKRAVKLSCRIYRMFRASRDDGFKDQITRSSLSIPSNIAEGFERESQKECLSFLSYAKGSWGELRTQMYIGIDIGYIEQAAGEDLIGETKEISAMLAGLIKQKGVL